MGNVLNCSVVSNSLRPHGVSPARLLYPWNFPGNNTGVGCQFLLQGIFLTQGLNLGLLIAQLVKNLPAMLGTQVRFPGWEDPLEKGMATHSSILAWKSLWTEKPYGL